MREFLLGTLTAPVAFSYLWIVVFGGAALRLERDSAGAGLCCRDQFGWFVNTTAMRDEIQSRGIWTTDISSNLSELEWMFDNVTVPGACATKVLEKSHNLTYENFYNLYKSRQDKMGSVSLDLTLSRLSCHIMEDRWFDLMGSYREVGRFLSIFSMLGIGLYFITSSDSGSIVIDCLVSLKIISVEC